MSQGPLYEKGCSIFSLGCILKSLRQDGKSLGDGLVETFASSPLSRTYFGLLVGVPGEGNSVVGNLLNVADSVKTLLVVSCGEWVETGGR